MTVETEVLIPISHDLDGVTATWTVPFELFEPEHLEARIVSPDGTDRVLILDEEYTLSILLDVEGRPKLQSTLTLTSPAGTSGTRLLLRRLLPITRDTELTPGPFPPKTVDRDFDELIMMLQQLQEQIGRAPLLAPSSLIRGLTLPAPPAPGSEARLIGWNAAGTGLENKAGGESGGSVAPNNVTTKYPADAGLSTDPTVDNSARFNIFLQELSDAGGGEFVGDGFAYYFERRPIVPSFVTVRSLKFLLGPLATATIGGGKKVAFSGVRLLAAASQGASTLQIDTSTIGGGPVSDYAKVGMPITISDGQTGESNSITAIDDGTRTITVANNLLNNYSLAGTRVSLEVAARLAANNTIRSDQVTVEAADIALLSPGDWVHLEDDRRTGDTTTWIEMRQVVDVEAAGTGIVRLSGQTRRSYLTSSRARLTVIDPARRGALIGCSVECVGEAAAARFDPLYEIRFAIDSVMIGNEYPGTDSVGRRGNMFRIHKSYNCHGIDCSGRNPLYTAEGEGNIAVIAYSTLCSFVRLYAQGARHGGQLVAATECAFIDGTSVDTLLTGFEGHGLNSVGCLIQARQISFAGRSASSSNLAIVMGNTTWLDGDHECLICDTRIDPFKGNSGVSGFRAFTPCSSITLKNVHVENCRKFAIHRDTSGAGDLVVSGLNIIDCSVRGCEDNPIDFQGKAAGGSVNSLASVRISGFRGEDLTRGILAQDVEGMVVEDSSLEYSTPDTTSVRAAMLLKRINGLRVINFKSHASNRGVDIEDCPGILFLNNHYLDLGDTQWLRDRGGCDGTEFRGCNAYTANGAAVTSDVSGGSTIVYKAVGNIGTETTTAYEFTGTYKVLGVAGSAGAGQELSFTADAQSLAAAANFAAMRTLLGLGVGSDVLAYDADLAAIAALTSAADRGIYATGAGTWALFTLTSAARSLLDDGNFATMRATLDLEPGTDVQAYHARLAALAGLTGGANKLGYFSGADSMAQTDLTAFARTLLDDADAIAVLTTLGLKDTTLQIPIDGGGATIATGVVFNIEVPWDVTVTGWRLLSGSGAASIVLDVWVADFANFPPTVADTITGSEKPTLSAVETAEDLTLSSWTVNLDKGQSLAINVDSASGIQKATLILYVSRR